MSASDKLKNSRSFSNSNGDVNSLSREPMSSTPRCSICVRSLRCSHTCQHTCVGWSRQAQADSTKRDDVDTGQANFVKSNLHLESQWVRSKSSESRNRRPSPCCIPPAQWENHHAKEPGEEYCELFGDVSLGHEENLPQVPVQREAHQDELDSASIPSVSNS